MFPVWVVHCARALPVCKYSVYVCVCVCVRALRHSSLAAEVWPSPGCPSWDRVTCRDPPAPWWRTRRRQNYSPASPRKNDVKVSNHFVITSWLFLWLHIVMWKLTWQFPIHTKFKDLKAYHFKYLNECLVPCFLVVHLRLLPLHLKKALFRSLQKQQPPAAIWSPQWYYLTYLQAKTPASKTLCQKINCKKPKPKTFHLRNTH